MGEAKIEHGSRLLVLYLIAELICETMLFI